MIAKPKRNSDITTNILPDGYVLLQLNATDWVYVLTPLAGITWEFCDGENTVEEIAGNVAQIHHSHAEDELAKQVVSLIEEFENAELLTSQA